MSRSTKKAAEQAERKKVQQRYADRREPDVIYPAKKQVDFYDEEVRKRVAVYVRVSTDNLKQETSYELQKNYYEEFVLKHPNWTLVRIYADKGISGTSTKHRDELNQMLADCKGGKIDLIITKSVSRLARNTVDCITMVRNLAELRNPVGVFFESECIFTLNEDMVERIGYQSVEFYSSTLLNGIIGMLESIDFRYSYRLSGEVDVANRVAYFSMQTLKKIERRPPQNG